jgi:gas vesicle protein
MKEKLLWGLRSYNMNKNEVSTLGIGLGVGLVVGAILGILFAPQSGKETRELVKGKAHDFDVAIRSKIGHGRLEDIKPK